MSFAPPTLPDFSDFLMADQTTIYGDFADKILLSITGTHGIKLTRDTMQTRRTQFPQRPSLRDSLAETTGPCFLMVRLDRTLLDDYDQIVTPTLSAPHPKPALNAWLQELFDPDTPSVLLRVTSEGGDPAMCCFTLLCHNLTDEHVSATLFALGLTEQDSTLRPLAAVDQAYFSVTPQDAARLYASASYPFASDVAHQMFEGSGSFDDVHDSPNSLHLQGSPSPVSVPTATFPTVNQYSLSQPPALSVPPSPFAPDGRPPLVTVPPSEVETALLIQGLQYKLMFQEQATLFAERELAHVTERLAAQTLIASHSPSPASPNPSSSPAVRTTSERELTELNSAAQSSHMYTPACLITIRGDPSIHCPMQSQVTNMTRALTTGLTTHLHFHSTVSAASPSVLLTSLLTSTTVMQTLAKHLVMFTVLPDNLPTSVLPTPTTIDMAYFVKLFHILQFLFDVYGPPYRRVLADLMQEYITLHCVYDVALTTLLEDFNTQFRRLSLDAPPTSPDSSWLEDHLRATFLLSERRNAHSQIFRSTFQLEVRKYASNTQLAPSPGSRRTPHTTGQPAAPASPATKPQGIDGCAMHHTKAAKAERAARTPPVPRAPVLKHLLDAQGQQPGPHSIPCWRWITEGATANTPCSVAQCWRHHRFATTETAASVATYCKWVNDHIHF
jgi:hypothetical protein